MDEMMDEAIGEISGFSEEAVGDQSLSAATSRNFFDKNLPAATTFEESMADDDYGDASFAEESISVVKPAPAKPPLPKPTVIQEEPARPPAAPPAAAWAWPPQQMPGWAPPAPAPAAAAPTKRRIHLSYGNRQSTIAFFPPVTGDELRSTFASVFGVDSCGLCLEDTDGDVLIVNDSLPDGLKATVLPGRPPPAAAPSALPPPPQQQYAAPLPA